MNEFYTYIYYDSLRNDIPIYAGKGKGNRVWVHSRKSSPNKRLRNRIRTLRKHGVEPRIEIYENLNEDAALSLEIWFIYKFGRKDLGTGTLYNETDGGDGIAGYHHTDESKKKIGKSSKERGRPADIGTKISSALIGRTLTPEHIENLSKSHTGLKQKESTIQKRIKKIKGKKRSEEQIKNMSKAQKGKPWSKARRDAHNNKINKTQIC
jgi:hypothetical protein